MRPALRLTTQTECMDGICRSVLRGGGVSHTMLQMSEGPPAQGLYDPANEHDACGVGFVVHVKGRRSHAIVEQALKVLINLLHRGACGCEANTGDGAGILIQMPDRFLRREAARLGFALPPERHYGPEYVPPREPACGRDRKTIRVDRHREGSVSSGARWRPTPRSSARAVSVDRSSGGVRRRAETFGPPAADADSVRRIYFTGALGTPGACAVRIDVRSSHLSSRTSSTRASTSNQCPIFPDRRTGRLVGVALVHHGSVQHVPLGPLAHRTASRAYGESTRFSAHQLDKPAKRCSSPTCSATI